MIAQGDGEIGAGKLTNEVMDIMTKVHLVVAQMTGHTATIGTVSYPTPATKPTVANLATLVDVQ